MAIESNRVIKMKPKERYKDIGLDVKDGSVECNFSEQLRQGLYRLDRLSLQYFGKTILITSGSELSTKHMKTSKHYPYNNKSLKGEAADIRTTTKGHYTIDQVERLQELFYSQRIFADNYDLVIEGDHMHLEYDPK